MNEPNEPSRSPALFGGGVPEVRDESAVARSIQEVQASLVIANRFPRDEIRAIARILEACNRKSLAEVAEYEYSRGGTRITGPTIDLLRAIANRWGNVTFGWSETDRSNGRSTVRCWAWDLQTNTKAERTFTVAHWRDTSGGGYELKDERDIYELCANMASRRVRACLEEVIDADVVDRAVDACRDTLKKGEKVPLKDRAVHVINAFVEFGVTPMMIEKRLGNKLEAISENQLASLRRVYKSLKDGVGRREDYFKSDTVEPNMAATPADDPAEVAAGLAPEPKPKTNLPAASQDPGSQSSPAAKSGIARTPEEAPVTQGAPASTGFNPIKAVRNLCKMAKIKEGILVSYLAQIGSTDGSPASLEEIQMAYPQLLKDVAEDWPALAEKILAEIKAE